MRAFAIAVLSISTVFAQNQCSQKCTPSQKLYFSNCEKVSVTPPAGPAVSCGVNLGISGDFLYWTVRQDGLFHAVSGVDASIPAGSSVAKGRVHDLNWEMDPGFRVSLSYDLPHDGWELLGRYTWMRTDVANTTRDPNLVSYWSINGNDPLKAIHSSSAKWKLHFDGAQLELGRNCYLSQYLKLRPHVGLNAAWIDQSYEVIQMDSSTTDSMKLTQDFWGVGLQAGLNTSWQFLYQFSLFGDLDLSILWGQFNLNRKDTTTAAGVTTSRVNVAVNPHTFEPVLGLAAGLRWEDWVSNNRYHYLFQAGWEHQLWILQNELIKVNGEVGHTGDLVLQGLTVRASLDF